jgi:Protein of unknown function (DUF3616)
MIGSRVELRYGATLDDEAGDKRLIDNVSAAAFDGRHLWTAADEGTSFQRLTLRGGSFEAARSFDLADFFEDYPPDDEDEADLEGLAYSEGRLWMTGSHALVRKKPDRQKAEKLLGKRPSKRELARTMLGFVEIDAAGEPRTGSGRRLPEGDEPGSLIAELARDWQELERAIKRPAKENGLDIEGIAVCGDRVFLGLRGPVVGPYAIVIEIQVEIDSRGLTIARGDGPACKPHLIDLGGLGVRDLAIDRTGLIVLAGPTLDMEGPFEIYRAGSLLDHWTGEPGRHREPPCLQEIDIDRCIDKRGRWRGRRPEAITVVADRLLVIAERDARAKDAAHGTLLADLLPLRDDG